MNRIVLVEWEDHLFDMNARTLGEFIPVIQIRQNVGFVVQETESLICIADGFWIDEEGKKTRIENTFTISKSMVKSIKELN